MSIKYKNPPIEEVLCEIHFIPSQPWDWTIPGLIYEKVKKNFPEKQQQLGIKYHIEPTERGLKHEIEPAPPIIQFLNEEKTSLIQVAPNLLIINQLKPYPNWEKFKPIIINNFNIYKDITVPKAFKKVVLKYLNILDFREQNVNLKDFLKYYPSVPEGLQSNQDSFFVRTEFPYEEKMEHTILTLSSLIFSENNTTKILFEISYVMSKPEYISFNDFPNWLEKAHSRIENAFESCITEKSRNMFGKE